MEDENFTKEEVLEGVANEAVSEIVSGIDFWLQSKGIVLTEEEVMKEIQRQLDKEE